MDVFCIYSSNFQLIAIRWKSAFFPFKNVSNFNIRLTWIEQICYCLHRPITTSIKTYITQEIITTL